jgi:MFS family permease
VAAPPSQTSSPSLPVRRGRSPLLPIFLIVLVDVLGFTIILPLLPFFSERLGATPTEVGALVSTYAACQLIAGPILGQISDRIGRKPVLLISQLGTLTGFLLMAFSQSLWVLFVARAIDGATAGNLTIAQAYISDVTRPEKRAHSFALIGIAFGFGFLVGPAVSGFLAHFGYQAPILAASCLSFTAFLCTLLLLPRHVQRVELDEDTAADPGPGGRRLSLISWGEYRRFFRDRELARLLIQWLLFSFSFSTYIAGFALFAERRYQWNGHPVGVREVGYIFAFNGFLGIIMQGGGVGRLVKWLGERRVVQIGFIASFFGSAATGFTHTIGQLLWVNGFASVFGAGLRPALTSLITQRAGKREQGVILGLTQSLMSIAQITAPVLAGFLINASDRFHDPRFLVIWAEWAGLLAACALFFQPRSQRTNPAAAL